MAIPGNYRRLENSERRPSPTATRVGPADGDEKVEVTIVLRRRVDGPPLPRPEDFPLPPGQRRRLSGDDFAARYGASSDDIRQVTELLTSHGLSVTDTNAAHRTVTGSGTVEQMSKTFAVELAYYSHDVTRRSGESPHTERYRGRDGFIHVPRDLVDLIIGVFGLDNRRITKRNNSTPPNTTTISVTDATSLYNFPTNSAKGQTIAIFSETGYQASDITQSFSTMTVPSVTDVSVDSINDGSADPETTQDIYIAGSAAPGAGIAVYFTEFSQKGWVDLIQRVVHPLAGDPICSVLSSSFFVSNGDDAGSLSKAGITTAFLAALTAAFQDAALQHVTVCIASGDTGTDSKVGDGKAHVQYPATDPWVLSVGGTTIGNINGSSFDEYVWNDNTGATGGGISDNFPPQSYQNTANVPASLNDSTHTGRGVPDVAANASPNSGYPLIVGGSPSVGDGTSASAPLWAGLIAVINAARGENVGFVNPTLYQIGSSAFRDIVSPPGPADNGFNGVAGYPVSVGWDASIDIRNVRKTFGEAKNFSREYPVPGNAFWNPLDFVVDWNILQCFSADEISQMPFDDSLIKAGKLELLLKLLQDKGLSEDTAATPKTLYDVNHMAWDKLLLVMYTMQLHLGHLDGAEQTLRELIDRREGQTNLSHLHSLFVMLENSGGLCRRGRDREIGEDMAR